MLSKTTEIRPLPAEVAAQVKSSIVIPSLSNVIIGLIENSLDAAARSIQVSVDFRRGSCTVEDDGYGIAPEEFSDGGGLGKQHHTSKLETLAHGRNGTFLSSLAALSVLTVTSHHYAYRSHATLVFHHSRPAARLVPAPTHHDLLSRDHGTRVTVQDLFGNMPVRVKQRGLMFQDNKEGEKEWASLNRHIVGLLLTWKSTTIAVRMAGSDKVLSIRSKGNPLADSPKNLATIKPNIFDLGLIRSILSQSAYIEPSDWDAWIKVSARTPCVTILGALSLKPATSKNVQFISVGLRHLTSETGGALYDEVNRIFALSSFGNEEDIFEGDDAEKDRRCKDRRFKQNGFTNKQLRGGGKGIDRWPMFVIRIQVQDTRKPFSGNDVCTLGEENNLTALFEVLRTMIIGFLDEHHIRHRISRKRRKPPNKSSNGTGKLGCKSPSHRPSSHSPIDTSIDPSTALDSSLVPGQDRINKTPESTNRSKRMKCERNMKPNFDSFGSNVKLPSFSQKDNYHRLYGFSSWSRIKSGRQLGLRDEIMHEKNMKNDQEASISKAAFDEEAAPAEQYLDKIDWPLGAKKVMAIDVFNAIVTSDLRNPVRGRLGTSESLITEVGLSEAAVKRKSINSMSDNVDEDVAEEIFEWTNPTNKAKVLISARTGHPIPLPMRRPSSSDLSSPATVSHPFSPTRSRSMNARLTRSGSDSIVAPKPGSWVSGFLSRWDNPIYGLTEENIPQVSLDRPTVESSAILHGRHPRCSQIAESSSSFAAKLSKNCLKDAEVIAQVDYKFVLVKINTCPSKTAANGGISDDEQLLVLIDQHAADERFRFEGLLADICAGPGASSCVLRSSLGLTSTIATTLLAKPIMIQIQPCEHQLFEHHASHFAKWGILYDLSLDYKTPTVTKSSFENSIVVKTLPAVIAERCRVEIKILIELMRGEVWKREELGIPQRKEAEELDKSNTGTKTSTENGSDTVGQSDWLNRIGDCPKGILDMLNSRSCRSAIMFNDKLTLDECRILVKQLAMCAFPFQCAHGRPSMIPIVGLGNEKGLFQDGDLAFGVGRIKKVKEELGFGSAWKNWREKEGEGRNTVEDLDEKAIEGN
ncbi:DNA mismatch repair protein [Toensbergia leucococca]|nr:DNA mismatch repair protein [Toensbergia leucococca]